MGAEVSPVDELLFGFHPEIAAWSMPRAERCAMLQVLEAVRPACAIEIGTFRGGSLAAIARHAGKVYAVDPDPSLRERLGPRHPNVEFVAGFSQEALPGVLQRIRERGERLEFALVDGDHRREAVRRDLELLLTYAPATPMAILMHDSFNPECRAGIAEAPWAASPHVHYVELDFVAGALSDHPGFERQMWNGLALALLRPEPRRGPLEVGRAAELQFRTAAAASVHGRYSPMRFWHRARAGLARRTRR